MKKKINKNENFFFVNYECLLKNEVKTIKKEYQKDLMLIFDMFS